MSFLDLQSRPYHEIATIRLRVVNEDRLPVKGRAWCALNLIGHSAKVLIKPVVYTIHGLGMCAIAVYKNSRDDLRQSARLFVCAILSPFTEAVNVCKAAMGIILPVIYYLPIVAVAMTDATYETNGEGNLDYSHVNRHLGLGFVIDGCGHNDPASKKIQDPLIQKFIMGYETALSTSKFDTMDAACAFIDSQLKNFAKDFNKAFGDRAPAIMFTQIIKIGNERQLFIAHMVDTALYLNTKDDWCTDGRQTKGWWTTPPPKSDVGLGSNGHAPGEINTPQIQMLPVSPGDEIIGFTDGIGEFLMKSECFSILNSNTNRQNLLQEFKRKIIKKGEENNKVREEYFGGDQTVARMAANSRNLLKSHNPNHKGHHDDISLFYLVVE